MNKNLTTKNVDLHLIKHVDIDMGGTIERVEREGSMQSYNQKPAVWMLHMKVVVEQGHILSGKDKTSLPLPT